MAGRAVALDHRRGGRLHLRPRHRRQQGAALRPYERARRRAGTARPTRLQLRSEEHTSELQSLMRISHAVFCLKKKKHTTITYAQQILLTTPLAQLAYTENY